MKNKKIYGEAVRLNAVFGKPWLRGPEKPKTQILDTLYNYTFDKGRLKSLVLWSLKKYGEAKTIVLLEKLKKTGFEYATKAGISLGVEDLKIPPKKALLLYEAELITKEAVDRFERSEITGVERYQRLIETWHRTSEELKQEVIDNFEKTDILNPVYMMAFSGARGNISQVRQLVGMRGLMSDPQGQLIDYPIRSNFREGLTITEYIISSYGARKGIVDTALRTATAGYLTRRLVDVAQHVVISAYDCGTHDGVFLTDIKEGTKTLFSLQTRLLGRVLARNLYKKDSNSKRIKFASRNQEVSAALAADISKEYKKVFVRSPLTCKPRNGEMICQLCYGWSLAQGNLVSIGEAVGIVAAQSIGEPGTQLTMRTFHTGGAFAGEISDQIRAPFNGIVHYPDKLAGMLCRNPDGRMVFLTKIDGVISISPSEVTSRAVEPKQFKIPAYTLLYYQSGQTVQHKQIMAQISAFARQAGVQEDVSLVLKSQMQGQLMVQNLVLQSSFIGPKSISQISEQKGSLRGSKKDESRSEVESFNLDFTYNNLEEPPYYNPINQDKVFSAWDWGYAWILSCETYRTPVLTSFNSLVGHSVPLLPVAGDFVDNNTPMIQVDWYLPQQGGFYTSFSTSTNIETPNANQVKPSQGFVHTENYEQYARRSRAFLKPKNYAAQAWPEMQQKKDVLWSKRQGDLAPIKTPQNNISKIKIQKNLLSLDIRNVVYKKFGYFVDTNKGLTLQGQTFSTVLFLPTNLKGRSAANHIAPNSLVNFSLEENGSVLPTMTSVVKYGTQSSQKSSSNKAFNTSKVFGVQAFVNMSSASDRLNLNLETAPNLKENSSQVHNLVSNLPESCGLRATKVTILPNGTISCAENEDQTTSLSRSSLDSQSALKLNQGSSKMIYDIRSTYNYTKLVNYYKNSTSREAVKKYYQKNYSKLKSSKLLEPVREFYKNINVSKSSSLELSSLLKNTKLANGELKAKVLYTKNNLKDYFLNTNFKNSISKSADSFTLRAIKELPNLKSILLGSSNESLERTARIKSKLVSKDKKITPAPRGPILQEALRPRAVQQKVKTSLSFAPSNYCTAPQNFTLKTNNLLSSSLKVKNTTIKNFSTPLGRSSLDTMFWYSTKKQIVNKTYKVSKQNNSEALIYKTFNTTTFETTSAERVKSSNVSQQVTASQSAKLNTSNINLLHNWFALRANRLTVNLDLKESDSKNPQQQISKDKLRSSELEKFLNNPDVVWYINKKPRFLPKEFIVHIPLPKEDKKSNSQDGSQSTKPTVSKAIYLQMHSVQTKKSSANSVNRGRDKVNKKANSINRANIIKNASINRPFAHSVPALRQGQLKGYSLDTFRGVEIANTFIPISLGEAETDIKKGLTNIPWSPASSLVERLKQAVRFSGSSKAPFGIFYKKLDLKDKSEILNKQKRTLNPLAKQPNSELFVYSSSNVSTPDTRTTNTTLTPQSGLVLNGSVNKKAKNQKQSNSSISCLLTYYAPDTSLSNYTINDFVNNRVSSLLANDSNSAIMNNEAAISEKQKQLNTKLRKANLPELDTKASRKTYETVRATEVFKHTTGTKFSEMHINVLPSTSALKALYKATSSAGLGLINAQRSLCGELENYINKTQIQKPTLTTPLSRNSTLKPGLATLMHCFFNQAGFELTSLFKYHRVIAPKAGSATVILADLAKSGKTANSKTMPFESAFKTFRGTNIWPSKEFGLEQKFIVQPSLKTKYHVAPAAHLGGFDRPQFGNLNHSLMALASTSFLSTQIGEVLNQRVVRSTKNLFVTGSSDITLSSLTKYRCLDNSQNGCLVLTAKDLTGYQINLSNSNMKTNSNVSKEHIWTADLSNLLSVGSKTKFQNIQSKWAQSIKTSKDISKNVTIQKPSLSKLLEAFSSQSEEHTNPGSLEAIVPRVGRTVLKGQVIDSKVLRSSESNTDSCSKNLLKVPGQIIGVHWSLSTPNKLNLSIRKGQPIFISARTKFHSFHGDFVRKNESVVTLIYKQIKTGDIIQGIPKVEQFFEARTTKRGRLFRENLPNLLKGLFLKYYYIALKKGLFLKNYYIALNRGGGSTNLKNGSEGINFSPVGKEAVVRDLKYLAVDWAVNQSFYKIRQIAVDGVLRVYRSQGVSLSDKHLEVIVKQMTTKVRVIDRGHSALFPGELVDYAFVQKLNTVLIKKVLYEPIVLGITKASLHVDSFLSAASFQQTARILRESALVKKRDFLKGVKENVMVGNLIPTGTGYIVSP